MPPAKSMKRLPSTSSMSAPSARAAKTFIVEPTPRATNCWRRASRARDFSPGIPRCGIVSDIKTSWFWEDSACEGSTRSETPSLCFILSYPRSGLHGQKTLVSRMDQRALRDVARVLPVQQVGEGVFEGFEIALQRGLVGELGIFPDQQDRDILRVLLTG